MSCSLAIWRSASGLRSAAGAALAALGVLVAVGVGALMIVSLSARRAVRPPSVIASCPQTLFGPWVRTPGAQSIARFGQAPAGSSIDLPGRAAETAGRSRFGGDGSPDAPQR
jgi:hypothetical protein